MNIVRILPIITIAFAIGATAHAHQLWVNATHYIVDVTEQDLSKITPAGVAYVGWGHNFPADSLPPADDLKPMTLIQPGGGSAPIRGAEEGFLAAPISVTKPGPYIVTVEHNGGYFTVHKEDGEVKHGQRTKEDLDHVLTSEYFEMMGKALVAVGDLDISAFTQPVGQLIEIVPATNPYTLTPGAETRLTIQIFLRGKPLEGATVTTFHVNQSVGESFVVDEPTNARGESTVALPHQGPWMIKATYRQPAPAHLANKTDEKSYTATMTFALPKAESAEGT